MDIAEFVSTLDIIVREARVNGDLESSLLTLSAQQRFQTSRKRYDNMVTRFQPDRLRKFTVCIRRTNLQAGLLEAASRLNMLY